jgi:hypothetical protein
MVHSGMAVLFPVDNHPMVRHRVASLITWFILWLIFCRDFGTSSAFPQWPHFPPWPVVFHLLESLTITSILTPHFGAYDVFPQVWLLSCHKDPILLADHIKGPTACVKCIRRHSPLMKFLNAFLALAAVTIPGEVALKHELDPCFHRNHAFSGF